MTEKDSNSRCQSLTKSGKPCRAAATSGGLCFFHANPNKASELGRIGGRSNRPLASQNPETPALALESATAVRETVARLIADLYAGKLHPRVAAGLGPLLNIQLRAIEKTDVERRVGEIEAQVRKLTLALEKNTQQRMAPERAKRLLEPEESEAIEA
jgi:Family of unknown function (DUF5763)